MRSRFPMIQTLFAVLLLAGGVAVMPPAGGPVRPAAVEAAKRDRAPDRPAPRPDATPSSEPDVENGPAVEEPADDGSADPIVRTSGKDGRKPKKPKKPKKCFGETRTVADQRGDIDGTAGADVIVGDDKKNTVLGNGGEDRICLGKGNDFAAGSVTVAVAEPMQIAGGPGNDFLAGEDGDDLMSGGSGDDSVSGGQGNNTLKGGPGNDDLLAFAGDDDLAGGSGDDRLSGFDGSDRLDGGPGDDLIFTNGDQSDPAPDGIDTVFGGEGDDDIRADDGLRDVIDCGPGKDTLTFDPGLDEVAANCETGA